MKKIFEKYSLNQVRRKHRKSVDKNLRARMDTIMLFYPMDFNYITPSEILAIDSIKDDLNWLDVGWLQNRRRCRSQKKYLCSSRGRRSLEFVISFSGGCWHGLHNKPSKDEKGRILVLIKNPSLKDLPTQREGNSSKLREYLLKHFPKQEELKSFFYSK